MEKTVITQKAPNLIGQPSVEFDKSSYEALIYNKGYEVIWEAACKCPCKTESAQGHLSNCQNCGSSGWVYINPVLTKMLLTSLNAQRKYSVWSVELAGTVNVTARDVNQLADMDRIIVQDSETIYSQTLYPKVYNNQLFAYTIYDILSVLEIFLFVSSSQKLTKLVVDTDFTFERNKILLNDKYKNYTKLTISVRYKHRIQYHVIDLPHEARNSRVTGDDGIEFSEKFPISAIARRSHFVLDAENFRGNLLFDNSYQTEDETC